jgi:pimeloyl-ACP methyl ester carboxylesterase
VTTSAFVALDESDQLQPDSRSLPNSVLDAANELVLINGTTRNLAPMMEDQLRAFRLNADRVVFVGFGFGGTLALHMSLHQGWRCAGVLAFTANLIRPLPRVVRMAHKVRLIECPRDAAHSSLRDDVALLTARGIDARGVLLSGSTLSPEVIRHGEAYLVELVATAQRGDRFQVKRGTSRAE